MPDIQKIAEEYPELAVRMEAVGVAYLGCLRQVESLSAALNEYRLEREDWSAALITLENLI